MSDKQDPAAELLHFNGVDGLTGGYGLPPMDTGELVKLITGEDDPGNLDDLTERSGRGKTAHLGVKEGIDPTDLAQAGWGIILPAEGADPAVKEALSALLDLRREQAGERFRIFEGADGFRKDDSKASWLGRHRMGPGPADPERVPYYLLLVGGPEQIPFSFQYQLDVQYAVGRIAFDNLAAYQAYAAAVVTAETGGLRLARKAAFFSAENPDDRATALSSKHLVRPLTDFVRKERPGWELTNVAGADATKARLARMLGGDDTPALLFSATHGVEFPPDDPRHAMHQGALLCSDWPGPRAWAGRGAVPQDHYLAADDLSDGARLAGLISFHFACYGGGVPDPGDLPRPARVGNVAARSMLAKLPGAALGHPGGGALATVAQVGRSWGYAFLWPGAGAQTTAMESTLARLLDGLPVGYAMEYLNQRHAELAVDLCELLKELDFGKRLDPQLVSGAWIADSDARSYLVIGDPAVRLPLCPEGEQPGGREPGQGTGPEPEISHEDAQVNFSVGAPAEAPVEAPDTDEVRFSAYHPRALEPEVWKPVMVYAHLAEHTEQVAADAARALGKERGEYRSDTAEASTGIARGTELTLVPEGPGLEFDPPTATVTWQGSSARADFHMRATRERAGHVAEGSVAVYAGPLLLANIRMAVVVIRKGAPPPPEDEAPQQSTASMYKAVFASYAHADKQVVEAVEGAYQALGMDYLRDVMTLRTGQQWSDGLLEMIEKADVFQLFWSDASSTSPYVEQEWRHALELAAHKGPGFIRPVYFQRPMPAVPAAMSHIHFAPADHLAQHAEATLVPAAPSAPAPAAPAALMEITRTLQPAEGADLLRLEIITRGSAELVATTRLSLDGDLNQQLPPGSGQELDPLIKAHEAAVSQAITARMAYLRLLAGLPDK